MTKLSYEVKRQINNKLTSITSATDKMMVERENVYTLVKEIKAILKRADEQDN